MNALEDRSAATVDALNAAQDLASQGRALEAIDLLHAANVASPNPDAERRLAALRYEAFGQLDLTGGHEQWPVPVDGVDRTGPAHIPQIAPADLDAEGVRRAIQSHGSVHVPRMLDGSTVQSLVAGIDTVLALRNDRKGDPLAEVSSWFSGLKVPLPQAQSLARNWVAGDGGILACDAPKLLDQIFAIFEAVGLRRVVADYLGERPVLSANKGTLRRARLDGKTDWHQDGAFLGGDLRALNVWVALTDCGDDAPSMDLVPKRFDALVETGSGGAIFDWAVGPEVVDRVSVDAPVVRPRFRAGDVMLFDELCLHRTGLSPEMTRTRHAIEAWFFAPSAYPSGQVPIVW